MPSKKGLSTKDWVSKQPNPLKSALCQTCSNPKVMATLEEILSEMAVQKAHHISVQQILDRLCELHPDFQLTEGSLARHLKSHQAKLFNLAKGKA